MESGNRRLIVALIILVASLLAAVVGAVLFFALRDRVLLSPAPPKLTIAEILANPREYDGRELKFSGSLRQAAYHDGLGATYLLIGDDTGEIWYREGGDVSAIHNPGQQIVLEGLGVPSLLVPDVGTVAIGLAKADSIREVTRSPSHYSRKELLLHGKVTDVRRSGDEPWVWVRLNDGSGQCWTRLPGGMLARGEDVTVLGALELNLSVPEEDVVDLVLVAADPAGVITAEVEAFRDRPVLIRGLVTRSVTLPVVGTGLELEDASGTILVHATQFKPQSGEWVMIWGDVKSVGVEGFTIVTFVEERPEGQ